MMVLRGDSEKVRVARKRGRAAQPQTHSPRDDDAKGPSSDPAERGEKHCSRQAVRRQSQDGSPNGRPASLRPTREWARQIPARAFSRRTTKRSFSPTAGAPASRSTTALTDSDL